MTNGTNFTDEDEAGQKFATVGYQVPVTEKAEVKGSTGSWYVVVENEPVDGTIYIQGFEAADLTIDTTDTKKILIDAAATPGFAAGDEIRVTYNYLVKNDVRETRIDNRSSAQGEVYLKFPVYSDGSDCSENGIIGHVLMHIYNARITGQPGLNGQYKTASTYDFVLSALDPHRNDDKIYSIAYYRT